jgi:hypothetical protein
MQGLREAGALWNDPAFPVTSFAPSSLSLLGKGSFLWAGTEKFCETR